MCLCHTAAILSRVTEIVLVYLPCPAPKGGKTKPFQSLGTTWPLCEKGPLST